MIDHIIDTYFYDGQSPSVWPRWLVFTNYAAASDGSRIVIPYLWRTLVVRRGDTIVLTATRELHVLTARN